MTKLIPAVVAAATLGLASYGYAQTSPTSPSTSPTMPSTSSPSSPSGASGSTTGTGSTGATTTSPSGAAGTSGAAMGPVTSESDVRQQLQKEGYTSVSDIKKQGDKWEAKAMKDGKSTTVSVDAQTGRVSTQ